MQSAILWQPHGTVYGTLLNFRREFELWAPKMTEAPYKAPPKAPVLYVKTANTFAADDATVGIPGAVEIGATVGLVIGDGARPAAAVLFDDLTLPHASYYRPAIRYRNRDGFLVCGPSPTPVAGVDLRALRIDVRLSGALVQTVDLGTLMRAVPALLADVSEFMTLQPGDVLLVGTDCLADGTRPRAGAGDRVEISAPGFATLTHTLVEEAA